MGLHAIKNGVRSCWQKMDKNEYMYMKALERICFRAFFVLVTRNKAIPHLCISYTCIDRGSYTVVSFTKGPYFVRFSLVLRYTIINIELYCA